eukprot:221650-Prymnesium_polylepis.1
MNDSSDTAIARHLNATQSVSGCLRQTLEALVPASPVPLALADASSAHAARSRSPCSTNLPARLCGGRLSYR